MPRSISSLHASPPYRRAARSFTLALALALGASGSAMHERRALAADASGSTVGAATKFLQGRLEAVQKILRTGAKDRQAKVDAELETLVEIDAMAKAALGDEFDKRTPEQRKEFADTFRALVQLNIRTNLDKGSDYEIAYVGEKPQGSDVLVFTTLTNRSDKRAVPNQVDYTVRKKGSDYVVVDYITEGSSATKSWNREVTRTLKKGTWDELMKKMKDKLAKG
jgi:ABC-type transporter MlaC component